MKATIEGENILPIRQSSSLSLGKIERINREKQNHPPVGQAPYTTLPVGQASRTTTPVGQASRTTPPVGQASRLSICSWKNSIESGKEKKQVGIVLRRGSPLWLPHFL